MSNKETRARERLKFISFAATTADGVVIASRGSIAEKRPATDEEKARAVLNLIELCGWLNPAMALPMDRSVGKAIYAKQEEPNGTV